MSGGYQEQGEKRTRRIGAVIPLRRLERPVLTMTVGHMLAELGGITKQLAPDTIHGRPAPSDPTRFFLRTYTTRAFAASDGFMLMLRGFLKSGSIFDHGLCM